MTHPPKVVLGVGATGDPARPDLSAAQLAQAPAPTPQPSAVPAPARAATNRKEARR